MPQNILENTMSESESDLAAIEDKPLSPLLLFSAKVAIVTVAILVILYGAGQLIAFQIESQTEQLALLKGGPAFWERVEGKLYRLADEPDLPPEKKQKIINALRKLSAKYKPYLDAVAGESLPGEPKK
jgi:hypothetical protein